MFQVDLILHAWRKKFTVCEEAFIDRTYQEDLSLTPRSLDHALIKDPAAAWQQLRQILYDKRVNSITNKLVTMNATTFCLHGDSENSLDY